MSESNETKNKVPQGEESTATSTPPSGSMNFTDIFKSIDFKGVLSQMNSLFDEGSTTLENFGEKLFSSDVGIIYRVNDTLNNLTLDEKEELVNLVNESNESNDTISEWWTVKIGDYDSSSNYNNYLQSLVEATGPYCSIFTASKQLGETVYKII